jgi:sugar lactone lactonase YvrE
VVDSMPEPIHNWDKVVHKNVRCEDNQSVGNIVAVNNDHIIVTSEGGMGRYRIPKSFVERYNGAEVFLKFPKIALGGFKV